MGKWLLHLIRLFNPIFRRQGIDVVRLYSIVELKMLMDTRRVYLSWKKDQQTDNKNHLRTILLLYALFGVVICAVIYQLPSLVTGMIIFHTYIIFMIAMTLITDFSAVLLDTADNQIILPRPVNSKTLLMARLIHVLIYLLQFSIAICLAPLILIFFMYGPLVGVGAIMTTQLTVLIAVFFTYILYLLMLRFGSEEKVKEFVTYFQILMTLFFSIGYQLIPRMIDLEGWSASFVIKWHSFLIPPVWMAVALEGLNELNFDAAHVIMVILAIAGPILLFWLLTSYLAPSFSRQIANLSAGGERSRSTDAPARHRRGISGILSRVICRSANERAMFETTWKITARDKSFKLQFYPALGYIPVFLFIVVFQTGSNMSNQLATLSYGSKFLWLIYLPLSAVSSCIRLLGFYENFQASWIYHSAPVARPGELLSGALKAVFFKFFIPLYLLFFAASLGIWGIDIIDDFLLGFLNSVMSLLLMSLLTERFLPFSRQPNIKQQSGKFVQVLVQFLLIGLLVLAHYLLIDQPWIMAALAGAALVGSILMLRNLQSMSWKKIAV